MLLAFSAAVTSLGWTAGTPAVANEILVGFYDRPSLAFAASKLAPAAVEMEDIADLGVLRIRLPDASSVTSAKRLIAGFRNVRFIEPNFLAKEQYVPNDPAFINQFNVKLVMAPQSWDVQSGSLNVIIAILDSGVDLTHPELQQKLLPGYDFVNNDFDPSDDFGHGTLCAGIAAAETNNGIGLAGAAPGCALLPVKVLDNDGFGSYADIAQGIRYAADHGAKVISMSFAGSSFSATLDSAVNYAASKGVTLVAAAGNQARNQKMYPAALTSVIAVASVNKTGRKSDFTNWGPWVDVAAPGELVYSTYLNGSYNSSQGTSMAAPLVAAQAALLASRLGPLASPGRIRYQIEHTSTPVGRWLRFGLVNFYRSLAVPGP